VSAVDFGAWVAPDLVLELGGNTYKVSPPSVEDAGKILALAVVLEVKVGLARGKVPDEVQAIVDKIQGDEHPALGDARRQMHKDQLLPVTIDRFTAYAIFFWARGKEYADAAAKLMWTPLADEAGGAAPKG
jgi:hypothetical protein